MTCFTKRQRTLDPKQIFFSIISKVEVKFEISILNVDMFVIFIIALLFHLSSAFTIKSVSLSHPNGIEEGENIQLKCEVDEK